MRRLLLTAIAVFAGYSAAMASGIAPGRTLVTYYNRVAAPYCGSPASLPTWTDHSHVRQQFQRCQLRARLRILTPTAIAPTPRPTLRPSPTAIPSAMPAPTRAVPTPVPTAPIASPTALPPFPTATGIPATDPVQRALQLINGHRAEYGVRPLTLNATQSVNSAGHAAAMAATGQIWHVNTLYPQYSFPNNIVVPFWTAGENVGAGGSVDQVDALMWSEPHYAGCSGSHACNDITAAYTSVGIGVYQSGGYTWYVADFVG